MKAVPKLQAPPKLTNRKKAQRILWYETVGFVALIALSWLNELLKLPHKIFGSGEHSNWHEAALETVVLIAVWLVVFLFTRRLLRRLYFLDRFLHVCAWCKKIGHDDRWFASEEYFEKGLDISTSHGMCPECQRKWEQGADKLAA